MIQSDSVVFTMQTTWNELHRIWTALGVPMVEHMQLRPTAKRDYVGQRRYGIIVKPDRAAKGRGTPLNGFEDMGNAIKAISHLRAALMATNLIVMGIESQLAESDAG